MNLVENIASRRPSNSELVREVRSLMDRGHKNTAMADKLGLDVTYTNNVVRLLKKGEERLIAQVEAGAIPLSIAVPRLSVQWDYAKLGLSPTDVVNQLKEGEPSIIAADMTHYQPAWKGLGIFANQLKPRRRDDRRETRARDSQRESEGVKLKNCAAGRYNSRRDAEGWRSS